MKYNIPIGIGLGVVAAVVFASASTGALVARFALAFITPLPIALAGLGWGWLTSAIAGAAGFAFIATIASPTVAGLFVVTQVIPMIVLTYLADLARPLEATPSEHASSAPGTASPQLEWYPPGRLVLWGAVLASILTILLLAALGTDPEDLRKAVSTSIEKTIQTTAGADNTKPLNASELQSLTEIIIAILPATVTISWLASLLSNLWLAGYITLASNQLTRPWPEIAKMEFPPGTALALAAALAASSAGGTFGTAATCVAGALFSAYVLLGLAVIHDTSTGRPWRPFVLWATYIALFTTVVWCAIPLALLGLAEGVLNFRARVRAHVPPAQPPLS